MIDEKANKRVVKLFFVTLIVFILSMTFSFLSFTRRFSDAWAKNYSKTLIDTTVKVQVESDYDGWQGSGVFIKDDLIITAGHVVDNAKHIVITLPDGNEYEAISWYKEDEADLGFIEVKTKRKEGVVEFDDAKVGETVWVVGNPFAIFPVVSKGIVSAINMPDVYSNQKNMIIVDAAVNPGNSGGPVYDEEHKILGICSWGFNGQGMSYFVRGEICKLALQKYAAIKALSEVE